MKKIFSVCLAVIISLLSLFVTAYASDTKTGALLEEIKTTKSYYVDFGDVFYEEEGAPFRDVKCYFKVYDNENGKDDFKIALTGKLWFFNVKLIITRDSARAYLPFVSIDLGAIFGSDTDRLNELYYNYILPLFGSFDSSFVECMKLKSAGEQDTKEYGRVYVEEFAPDIKKMLEYAEKNGLINIPDDSQLAGMTEEEIINWLKSLGQKGENVLRMFESNAVFYYEGDKLIAYKVTLYDAANDNAVLNSEDLMIKRAKDIGSSVPDSVFDAPIVLFDVTSIFTLFFGNLFSA